MDTSVIIVILLDVLGRRGVNKPRTATTGSLRRDGRTREAAGAAFFTFLLPFIIPAIRRRCRGTAEMAYMLRESRVNGGWHGKRTGRQVGCSYGGNSGIGQASRRRKNWRMAAKSWVLPRATDRSDGWEAFASEDERAGGGWRSFFVADMEQTGNGTPHAIFEFTESKGSNLGVGDEIRRVRNLRRRLGHIGPGPAVGR